MKALLLISVSFWLYLGVYSQEVAFKTLATSGTCMIQRGANPDEFVKVTQDEVIYSNDKIIITGTSSYIGLISTDGKTIEISESGVFSAQELMSKLVVGSAPITQKYAKLLAANVKTDIEGVEKYRMYTGSVERSSTTYKINLLLPLKTKIAKYPSTVYWSSDVDNIEYTVQITNLYEERIFSRSTSEDSMVIDFSSLDLKPGQVYKLLVYQTNEAFFSSNEVALQIPTRSELAKYEIDLEMLYYEISQHTTIGNMIIATYLEAQGLYLQSIPYYKKALAQEPELDSYKKAYHLFLYKAGIQPAVK